MNWTDTVNALWELAATGFVLLNVARTHKAGGTAGVSRWNQLYFTLWGVWNLVFYPFNDHWMSAAAGACVAAANALWLAQCLFWDRKEKCS